MVRLPLANGGLAQNDFAWRIPNQTQKLDFSDPKGGARVRFTPTGMALEITLQLTMIRQESVTIQAKLPEPGRLEIVNLNKSLEAEIRNVQTKNLHGSAEIVPHVAPRSMEGLRNQAQNAVRRLVEAEPRREAKKTSLRDMRDYLRTQGVRGKLEDDEAPREWIKRRAIELAHKVIPPKLEELAAKHKAWGSVAEAKSWTDLRGQKLMEYYAEFLRYDMMESYLTQMGFRQETKYSNFRNLLDTKTAAVCLIHSGELLTDDPASDPDKAKVLRVLTRDDLNRLRTALTAEVRCRFLPAVDEKDPNSQWFNAQNIACLARGVQSVTVTGTLHKAQHDRVDWFRLHNYDASKVRFIKPQGPGYRVKPLYIDGDQVRLRIVAETDGPLTYTLKFTPTVGADGLELQLRETPVSKTATFPF